MASITRFITTKLKLKVNQQKSAVARPWERKFLGFSFTANREPKAAHSAESGDPVQSESPGSDATDAGRERGEDGRGVGPFFAVGLAISVNVRRPRCCKVLRSGPGAGCGLRSGSSGNEIRFGLLNCGNGEWAKTSPRKRWAALTVRGGWQTARHSHLRCPMLTSTRSGFRD